MPGRPVPVQSHALFSAVAPRSALRLLPRLFRRLLLVPAWCLALYLALPVQQAPALTPPQPGAAITDEALLPYQDKAQLLEETLRRHPGEEDLLLRLADLKLFQAQKAAPALEVRLLQQVVELWDNASAPPESRSLPIRIVAAASLKGKARQDAFARARAAYLQATGLTDADTPGGMADIGWLDLLAGTAAQRSEPGLRKVLGAEIARIAPAKAFPGTATPLEDLSAAKALLQCAALPELSGQMPAYLQAILQHLGRAQTGIDAPEWRKAQRRESLVGSLELYRGMALLLRACASKGKAREENLRGFCDALTACLAATPSYYAAHDDPRAFSREQEKAVWKKAEKTLNGRPLFLAGKALWLQKYAAPGRGERQNIRDLLLEAARKAPGERRVWAAAALVARRDNYGEIFKTEKSRIYAHDACASKTGSSWPLWKDALRTASQKTDTEKALKILTDEISAADARFHCPAFAAWAQGVLAARYAPTDIPRATRFLEKAAAQPHSTKAEVFIYGELGDVWRTAAGRDFDFRDASAERLAVRQKARAAYRAAARAFAAASEALSNKPAGGHNFPWRQAYENVLKDLLRSPACPLDTALLSEARAVAVKDAAPESAKGLRAWAGVLGDAARPPYPYETPQDKTRGKELYDLLLGVYARLETLEPDAALYAARGGARLRRAKLTPPGHRAEPARAAVADYEKALTMRVDGEAHAGLARALLMLSAESPAQDIPDLMRRAYASFCLASGLPQGTARSREQWSKIARAAAQDAAPAAREAMNGALPQATPKPGPRHWDSEP